MEFEKRRCESDRIEMNIADCANMMANLVDNGWEILEEHRKDYHEILLHVLAGELVTELLIDLLEYHMDRENEIWK